MEISCYVHEGFSYTKKDLEKFAHVIEKLREFGEKLKKTLTEAWENLHNGLMELFDSLNNQPNKLVFDIPSSYFPPVKVPTLKSQVLENKPRYSRIRNNI